MTPTLLNWRLSLLWNENKKQFYIGITTNLKRRLEQHKSSGRLFDRVWIYDIPFCKDAVRYLEKKIKKRNHKRKWRFIYTKCKEVMSG